MSNESQEARTPVPPRKRANTQLDFDRLSKDYAQLQDQVIDMRLEINWRTDQVSIALASMITVCELLDDWRKRGMQETAAEILRSVSAAGELMEGAKRGEACPLPPDTLPADWYCGVLRGYLDAELSKQADSQELAPPT